MLVLFSDDIYDSIQLGIYYSLLLSTGICCFLPWFLVCCSGERTTTVEWPKSLEIKGRVRLDAFEKFIKELPMSRSRAVMVSQGPLLFTGFNLSIFFLASSGFSLFQAQCSLVVILLATFNHLNIISVYMNLGFMKLSGRINCSNECSSISEGALRNHVLIGIQSQTCLPKFWNLVFELAKKCAVVFH